MRPHHQTMARLSGVRTPRSRERPTSGRYSRGQGPEPVRGRIERRTDRRGWAASCRPPQERHRYLFEDAVPRAPDVAIRGTADPASRCQRAGGPHSDRMALPAEPRRGYTRRRLPAWRVCPRRTRLSARGHAERPTRHSAASWRSRHLRRQGGRFAPAAGKRRAARLGLLSARPRGLRSSRSRRLQRIATSPPLECSATDRMRPIRWPTGSIRSRSASRTRSTGRRSGMTSCPEWSGHSR
jgi:hypothetical protein